MITYSTIKKSQVEGSSRIDAEYYQPEYLEYIEKIKNISKCLFDYTKSIKHPAEIKRVYEKTGLPFLLTQNISPEIYTLQIEEERFITEEDARKIPQNKLVCGDVVMTRTGANYGDVAVYLGNPDVLYASAHVLIIRPENITGEYLSVYFNSKIGRALVKRGVYGTSQPEISPEYLKTLLVPLPTTETIDSITHMVRTAYKLITESKKNYSQAEDLLLEELGLKDYEKTEDLSCVVNLSDLKSANRIDSEYFQPKYERIIESIKKHNIKLLGDLANIKKGFEPGSDVYKNDGKLFIRVSSITKDEIVDKDQKYLSDGLYQELKKNYEPRQGEILLTKDAKPGIAYVLKDPIGGIIASGVVRLKLKEDIEPEYLALCINSIIGKMQIERDAGGSVIIHWKPEQIKNLKIPVLSNPTQHRIADLVKQSHEARKRAKELLELAKQKVEDIILENN